MTDCDHGVLFDEADSHRNTLQRLLRALERGEYRLKHIVLEDSHCHRVTTVTLVPNKLRGTGSESPGV